MFVDEKKYGEQTIDEIGIGLMEVADYLEKYGWCRGRNKDIYGRSCIAGALYYTNNHKNTLMIKRLNEYLKMDIVSWNDTYCFSKDEAIKTLRRAARG